MRARSATKLIILFAFAMCPWIYVSVIYRLHSQNSDFVKGKTKSTITMTQQSHQQYCADMMAHHTASVEQYPHYHNPKCHKHYCFLVHGWSMHGAELTALLWNIFSQRGRGNVTIVLYADEKKGRSEKDTAYLEEQQQCFGRDFVDVVFAPYTQPLNQFDWGYSGLDTALEYLYTNHPECTHLAGTNGHNLYSHKFVMETCKYDEDIIMFRFAEKTTGQIWPADVTKLNFNQKPGQVQKSIGDPINVFDFMSVVYKIASTKHLRYGSFRNPKDGFFPPTTDGLYLKDALHNHNLSHLLLNLPLGWHQ